MSWLKFYVKFVVIKMRTALLFFAPMKPNRDGWEDRLLLINLDLIGDIVMFTAILKQYRAAMPGKKLFLLLSSSAGVHPMLVRDYVDEVIMVDGNAFKSDPFYGYFFIKNLRGIGFATVVEHNPGMEFVGKFIATEICASTVIGYYGLAIDEAMPPDANFSMGLHYFRRTLSKKFTKIIPAVPEFSASQPKRFAHMILHYAAIFEGVTGKRATDYVPQLPAKLPSDETVGKLLESRGIAPFSYCLLSLGTSTPHKEWPVARFIFLGKSLAARGIPIVLIGTKKDIAKSHEFVSAIGEGFCYDLTGRTSILEAASLVRYALLALSNDTSIAHFAIAFRRPSLTILWLAQPGRTSLYGYRDINMWVFKQHFPCFGDNGLCAKTVGPMDPAPCVAAITVTDAEYALIPLLDHIQSGGALPVSDFTLAV